MCIRDREFIAVVEEFKKELESYEPEEVPETYYLTASQHYIEPSHPLLNRSIAEIELDIQKEDLPDTPEIRRMANLRGALLDYAKNLNNTNQVLSEIEDFGQFSSVLAKNDQSVKRIASLSAPRSGGSAVEQASFFGEGIESVVQEAALSNSRNLIAALPEGFDQKEAATTGNSHLTTPKGFYIIINGQNENILNYTDELGGKVHTLFTDSDNDGDQDIILAMGGDVYLKENYTEEADQGERGDLIISLTRSSVSDFVNEGGNGVDGANSPYENHERADLNWLAKDKETIAYEVVVRKSLDSELGEDALFTYIAIPTNTSGDTREDLIDEIDHDEVIDLNDISSPNIALELKNGNYYTQVYAINEDMERSLPSSKALVAPQICANQDAPLPALSQTSFRTPLFKTLKVDASGSIDPTGEIVNGSISFEDDQKPFKWKKLSQTEFEIGPFEDEDDLGTHRAMVNVTNLANRTSSQEITIEVFVPDLTLDESFGISGIASGDTIEAVDQMPISLMRNRFILRVVDEELKLVPRIDKVTTPSSDANGKYLTEDDGKYEIDDFDLENMILVENSDGEIIAEIDPETGNIGGLGNGYTTAVNEAEVPNNPTNVDILSPTGNALATVYLISDSNIDATVHQGMEFDAENTETFAGVHVSDLDNNNRFEFRKLPSTDQNYPGGIVLIDQQEDKEHMYVDTSGNIIVIDDRVELRHKNNDHEDDPLVIEVFFDGEKIGEIYIDVRRKSLVVGPNDVPFTTPRAPDLIGAIEEIEYDRVTYDLFVRGIIDDLDEDSLVRRADFVKIMLSMMCIVPSEAAYEPYGPSEAGGGYSDIFLNNPLDWYYPYIKEASLLGLVEGYTGPGDVDPITGLAPFKVNAEITRAEAVKVILEAMELKGFVDLGNLPENDIWYVPYMEAAENLSPYLIGDADIRSNYIVTRVEAQEPNETLVRKDLFEMVARVLEVFDCTAVDNDGDGMSDFCEARHNISDPNADIDNDRLSNLLECRYGLDPRDSDSDDGGALDGAEVFDFGTDALIPLDDPVDQDGDGLSDAAETLVHGTDPGDPDTDDGGVNDGQEVSDLTDPLNPEDDGQVGDYKEGENGVYIVPAECNSCPCESTLLHKADIIEGDIFFSTISNNDDTHIFSKSNNVNIKSINE